MGLADELVHSLLPAWVVAMSARTWARATLERTCGRCGLPIPPGAWTLLLTLPGMRRALPRCATCAREAAEAEPPLTDPAPVAAPMRPPVAPVLPWAPVVPPAPLRLVRDYRREAANDREDS